MRILFVCTGNSCRSPMAELYFEELCRKAGRDDIDVRSAGTCAWDGGRISAPAAAVMRELGIDGGTFRSARLTDSLAADFDLIVAMTRGHASDIQLLCPSSAGKVRLLLEFDGGGDVPDPYGGSVEHYRRVFESMSPALENLASFVMNSK